MKEKSLHACVVNPTDTNILSFALDFLRTLIKALVGETVTVYQKLSVLVLLPVFRSCSAIHILLKGDEASVVKI